MLIAYFSWAENAVLEGDVDAVTSPSVLAPGNVQQLAGWVQEETGGDLFSIQVTDPYPSDWDACLERANQEPRRRRRLALVRRVENLDQYDVVFLRLPQLVVRRAHGRCSPSWRRTTSPANRSTSSARTGPGAWRAAWRS